MRTLVAFAFAWLLAFPSVAQQGKPMGPAELRAIVAAVEQARRDGADPAKLEAALAARSAALAKIVGSSGGRFEGWVVLSNGGRELRDGAMGLSTIVQPNIYIQTRIGTGKDPDNSVALITDFDLNAAMRDARKGMSIRVSGEMLLRDGAPRVLASEDDRPADSLKAPAFLVRFTAIGKVN